MRNQWIKITNLNEKNDCEFQQYIPLVSIYKMEEIKECIFYIPNARSKIVLCDGNIILAIETVQQIMDQNL